MTHISRTALGLAALLAMASPAAAQGTLEDRMRAFLGVLGERRDPDYVATFFPRHGDWDWIKTLVDPPAVRGIGTWRFPGAETRKAMEPGAPLCNSLAWSGGDFGPWEGAFVMQVMQNDAWRRVTPTRFVPRGSGPDSPHFVEWRREDGRWVVSALGDEGFHWEPPSSSPPRPVPNEVSRDTMPAANAAQRGALAAGHTWYIDNEMITYGGRSYVKHGLPRQIEPDLLRRFGSLHGVPVYVEAGPGRPDATVLYLPVSPGELQPYQSAGGSSCDVW